MTDPTEPSARTPMSRRQTASLVVLSAAVFLVAVDGTVMAIAVPELTAELRPSYTQVLWIGDIYSFMLAGLLVTAGNMGDRIGRKRLLLFAAAGFGIMSVAAAMAPTPELLIAARALQGVAGAGLMPPTLALIRSVFNEPRQRTRAIGIWSAAGSAGASVGPTLAGLLLSHFFWGSVLLINVPVVIFIVAVGAWVLPESRGDSKQPLDVLSILLSTAGIIGTIYAITEFAHSGFGHLPPWIALVVSVPMLVLFLRRQLHLPVPLLDLSLFSILRFRAAVVAEFSVVFAATGALFFLPIYFQEVLGYSAMRAGVSLLPVSLVSVAVSPNTGKLIRAFGARKVLLSGMLASTIGLVSLGLLESQPYWAIVGPLVLLGYGFASVLTVAADLVLMSAPHERAGAATGVSETSFELGSALGIALIGSAITAIYQARLSIPAGVPEQLRAAVTESVSGAAAAAASMADPQLADALLTSAGESFAFGLTVAALAAGVALAGVTWWVQRMTRDARPAA